MTSLSPSRLAELIRHWETVAKLSGASFEWLDTLDFLRELQQLREKLGAQDRDAQRYHFLYRQSVESELAVYRIRGDQLGEDQFELMCGPDLEMAIDMAMESK